MLQGFCAIILKHKILEGLVSPDPAHRATAGPELLGWAIIFSRIVEALGFRRMVTICGAGTSFCPFKSTRLQIGPLGLRIAPIRSPNCPIWHQVVI